MFQGPKKEGATITGNYNYIYPFDTKGENAVEPVLSDIRGFFKMKCATSLHLYVMVSKDLMI